MEDGGADGPARDTRADVTRVEPDAASADGRAADLGGRDVAVPADRAAIEAAAPPPPGAWWNPRWTRRRRLVATGLGPEVTGAFPLLASLDTRAVRTNLPGAADLRFVADDGTLLPHEVETWESDVRGLVWIMVPDAAIARRGFWMYFGTGATEPAAPSVGPERGVAWHLSGDGRASGVSALTATMVREGEGTGFVAARIGGGFKVEPPPVRSRLALPMGAQVMSGLSQFTVSAWVNYARFARTDDKSSSNDIITVAPDPAVYNGDRNANHVIFAFGVQADTGALHATVRSGPSDESAAARTAQPLTAGTWQHVAVVVDMAGKSAQFYLNGAPVEGPKSLAKLELPAYPARVSSLAASIGSSPGGNYGLSNAIFDELRIEPAARSAPWLKATYQNMVNPEAFVQVSAEDGPQ